MKKFAKVALGAVMLAGAATAVASSPADARVVVGVGIGAPGYYGGPYYGGCYRYYDPYYCGYYGPAYYGGYYGPGFAFGWGGWRGGGWHGGGGFHGGGFHGGGHHR